MRECLKRFAKYAGVWLGIFFGMYLLLVISFALPNGRVRRNVSSAAYTLAEEGVYPDSYIYNRASQLDNYTDAIILAVAYNGDNGYSAFQKAVSNSYYRDKNDSSDEQTINNLVRQTKNNLPTSSNYSRYWFATSGIVRFLLAFVNYQQIRSLLFVIVFILLIVVCCAISQYLGKKYAVAFAIPLLFMRIYIIPNSLQFAPVTIIALLSVLAICLLSKNEKLKKYYPCVFLASGTLTAFFDLLTFPLISLGLPLVTVLLFNLKTPRKKFNMKKTIFELIKYCVIWGACYGATYFIKWVFTSILLNENTIAIAIEQFFFRTGVNGEVEFKRTEMLDTLFTTYYGKIGLALLILWLIAVVAVMIIKKKQFDWKKSVLFLAIAILPYVWYLVLANHSYWHFWMTYRIQAISLFAILGGTLLMLESETIKPRKKEKKE